MVVLYSKDNCMQCDFTKKFLEDKGIPYEVKPVDKNEALLEEVKTLGFSSLPVVLAKGLEPFNGFRPDKLNQLA